MLKIICDANTMKVAEKDVIKTVESIGKMLNIKKSVDGWLVFSMAYANCEWKKQKLYLNNNVKPCFQELIEKYPEIELKGSLQLGDDNYRQWYWFSSSAGSTDISYDYSTLFGDFVDKSDIGMPLLDSIKNSWAAVASYTGYGVYFKLFSSQKELLYELESFVSSCESAFEESEDDDERINLCQEYIFDEMDDWFACVDSLIKKIDKKALTKEAQANLKKVKKYVDFTKDCCEYSGSEVISPEDYLKMLK